MLECQQRLPWRVEHKLVAFFQTQSQMNLRCLS